MNAETHRHTNEAETPSKKPKQKTFHSLGKTTIEGDKVNSPWGGEKALSQVASCLASDGQDTLKTTGVIGRFIWE